MIVVHEVRMMNAIIFVVLLLICGRPVVAQDNGPRPSPTLETEIARMLASGRFEVTTDPISDIVVVSDRVAGNEFDYAYAVSNILETVDLLSKDVANGRRTPLSFGIVYRANPQIRVIGSKQTKFYTYALPLDDTLSASYWSATPAGKTDIVKKVIIKGEAPAWKSWNIERSFSSLVIDDPNKAAATMVFFDDDLLRSFAWKLSKLSATNPDKAEIVKITSCHVAHYLDLISLDKWDRTFA